LPSSPTRGSAGSGRATLDTERKCSGSTLTSEDSSELAFLLSTRHGCSTLSYFASTSMGLFRLHFLSFATDSFTQSLSWISSCIAAKLPSAGLWLNASKSESMPERSFSARTSRTRMAVDCQDYPIVHLEQYCKTSRRLQRPHKVIAIYGELLVVP
jgi:hypothetical protein